MPEVSRFFGIVIQMYYDEHDPPHFHAIYGEHEAQISITPIGILRGSLPSRASSMVIEWAALQQRGLLENWRRMRADMPPIKLPPLR